MVIFHCECVQYVLDLLGQLIFQYAFHNDAIMLSNRLLSEMGSVKSVFVWGCLLFIVRTVVSFYFEVHVRVAVRKKSNTCSYTGSFNWYY